MTRCMKKILFIDRDGTIIKEPPGDFQVDNMSKLEFVGEGYGLSVGYGE